MQLIVFPMEQFFWDANVFLNDAYFKTWFSLPLCCLWPTNDFYKVSSFHYFYIFCFPNESWAWIQSIVNSFVLSFVFIVELLIFKLHLIYLKYIYIQFRRQSSNNWECENNQYFGCWFMLLFCSHKISLNFYFLLEMLKWFVTGLLDWFFSPC